MIHEFNLHPGPFDFMKKGLKDIEMRLYDEKRKVIQVGDIIVFTNSDSREQIKVEVISLHRFANFEEIYQAVPKERLGYSPTEKAHFSDMEYFYSKEKIAKYGVVGIEIKLIS